MGLPVAGRDPAFAGSLGGSLLLTLPNNDNFLIGGNMDAFLRQDRRVILDRRSGTERRRFANHHFRGLERRLCSERRSGRERRKWVRLLLKLGCRPSSPLTEQKRLRQSGIPDSASGDDSSPRGV